MPGQIFRHTRCYHDAAGWHTKYLLVLATDADNVVYRLLTSRAHARPKIPPTGYHGDPYPGYWPGQRFVECKKVPMPYFASCG